MNHVMIDGEKLDAHELIAIGYYPFEVDLHLRVVERLFEMGDVNTKVDALNWLEDAVRTGRVDAIKYGQSMIEVEEKKSGLIEKMQGLFA